MLFREREKALGRSTLIFPVEYVDIADLRGPLKDRVADPKALELLKQRQITRFSRLRRHNPATSAEVGDFVEHLATEIKNRLIRHAAAPPPPPPRPPGPRPGAVIQAPRGRECWRSSRTAPSRSASGPAPRTPPQAPPAAARARDG
jgi:hypothetical protein